MANFRHTEYRKFLSHVIFERSLAMAKKKRQFLTTLHAAPRHATRNHAPKPETSDGINF